MNGGNFQKPLFFSTKLYLFDNLASHRRVVALKTLFYSSVLCVVNLLRSYLVLLLLLLFQLLERFMLYRNSYFVIFFTVYCYIYCYCYCLSIIYCPCYYLLLHQSSTVTATVSVRATVTVRATVIVNVYCCLSIMICCLFPVKIN